MFYQVGNTVFRNKYLAGHHAGSNNLNMHFNLHEKEFDAADWSREPSLTWNQLLDMRAHQLAAKNKPLVLNFSGGTDSYTIYKVFERNRIHLDAIYLRVRVDEVDSYHQVFDLFKEGLYDKTIKIIAPNDATDLLKLAYDSPNWIWESPTRHQFGIISANEITDRFLSQHLNTRDFVSISGLEKPRLDVVDDVVYSYQDDEVYGQLMESPNSHNFYITPDMPELHIKQSYMMLNYIKSQCPGATSPKDIKHYKDLHRPHRFDWHEYSIKACGRFGDINYSQNQHKGNAATELVLPKSGKFDGTEMRGRPAKWYRSLYSTDRKTFDNYTSGYMDFLNDTAYQFLQGGDNLFGLRQFRSKYYKLTF